MPPTQLWKPYPEQIRETTLGDLEVEVFEPRYHQVVLGAGGKPEKEVYLDRLLSEKIPLYKRKGGGGTVLLGPGVIVVTVHAGVAHLFQNLAYFRAINQALIRIFRSWKSLDFQERGISDIAVGNRKISGSSIFRRKHYLLYQASILVETDLEKMERLLKPPPRQPEYRQNRAHRSFLTSLGELGIGLALSRMITDLQTFLPTFLVEELVLVDGLDTWR